MGVGTAAPAARFSVVNKCAYSGNRAVTIDSLGAETIDGAATRALAANHDSVIIQSDGTEWHTQGAVTPVIDTIAMPGSNRHNRVKLTKPGTFVSVQCSCTSSDGGYTFAPTLAVYVQLRDHAGNDSAVLSQAIRLNMERNAVAGAWSMYE